MALEYYLKKHTFDGKSSMYVPHTRSHNVINKDEFIKKLQNRGSTLKEPELRGTLDLIIDTLENILSEGSEVNIDGFIRFSSKVKGRFADMDEKYHRSKHCIKVNTVVSRDFNKRVNHNVYVKKISKPENNTVISSVVSHSDKKQCLSFDYPNQVYGSRLKYYSRELSGITIIDRLDKKNIFNIPLDDIVILTHTKSRLYFNFSKNIVLPVWLENSTPVLTALVYNNTKTGNSVFSNYYETEWNII